MASLPGFTDEGLLPAGDYSLTLDELRTSHLVSGSARRATWDGAWRARLIENLAVLVRQLWAVNIRDIFINGSFVEDKDHPNDIDGYFVCDEERFRTRRLHADLNAIDPAKCWTWDHSTRKPYRGYPKLQLPMWHTYRVELYPHYPGVIAGRDEHGESLEFPAFFRKHRTTGARKGIVRLDGASP